MARKKAGPRTDALGPKNYRHPDATSPMRPEVGTQPQFRKKKLPKRYRYDSSLAPSMNWDGQNPARELGEWLLAVIEEAARLDPPHVFPEPKEFRRGGEVVRVDGLLDAARMLKAMSGPFLEWSGKAERLSFDVPTLPLFVHERLSTRAIVETLKSHRKDKGAEQGSLLELFGDPRRSVTDQVLKAYEHQDPWVNRLILGDSLAVMNSLLEYEGLGGKVQMIYMDPPYGVKFGSNFQPFVRKRDVKHNDDEDMTREPEMVKAYRDTWEIGLHSYLTYLRDRFLIARELLSDTGSIFIQINNENLHNVRLLLDEIFGYKNLLGTIAFKKTGYQASDILPSNYDFICWYAKDSSKTKYHQIYIPKLESSAFVGQDLWFQNNDGSRRRMTKEEISGETTTPEGARIFRHKLAEGAGSGGNTDPFMFEGKEYRPKSGKHWSTTPNGMNILAENNRFIAIGKSLRFVNFLDDFPVTPITNIWTDTVVSGFSDPQVYVVQTSIKVLQRCILMTTDPGDLVLDPTCGSGTTAYVAEQWGRRWITTDVSRVPIALARQRLLTATFPWYELQDEARGPSGGFVYKRKQNRKGEEIGGIVPHVTLKSIANNEPPQEEVLVDWPEVVGKITRVCGPFCVEATIPTPVDWEGDGEEDSGAGIAEEHGGYVERMLEILRKSPVLHLPGNKTVTLETIRQPAKTLSLSAEALATNGGDEKKIVALVFGPENGAVSEKLVWEAAREASAKQYAHLYVIGFQIQPDARALVEQCAEVMGVPATYIQATPDLLMGDLLKNMRSSQIFSVCGLPDVKLKKLPDGRYQAILEGLDTFDPITMENDPRDGDDVPAWFLDTDYNEKCFHVCQAFFPRTSAWDNLRKCLKADYEESVWKHLSGTKSIPFAPGESGQIAVKVIDDRGNELMVVKKLAEADA